MSISLVFLAIAVLFALAAGIVYVVQHPEVLGFLQQSITAAKSASTQTAPRQRVGYRAGPAKFTERMGALDPDTLLTIRDPQTGLDVQLQVMTCETLYGRRQYRGSPEWKRSGDNWQGVLCVADPDFSETKVLLLQTNHVGYLFKKRTPINPEGAAKIQNAAQQFAKKNQEPGSVSLTYERLTYEIRDIGVWDVEGKDDDPHIPTGTLARWILATGADGSFHAILVEDAKGAGDSIWTGYAVNLDRVVTDVLTKDG